MLKKLIPLILVFLTALAACSSTAPDLPQNQEAPSSADLSAEDVPTPTDQPTPSEPPPPTEEVTPTAQRATSTASATSRGPVEPCQLSAAAFTNVGLGIPRPEGFTPSTGTVEAAVLFADFGDAPASETPAETFARVSPGAADFFHQTSYGRMTLRLQPHLQWLRLSEPSDHYATLLSSGDGHRAFIQEAVDLADAAVDFSHADLVVVLANPEATAIRFGPAFGAAVGEPAIEADGVSIPSGVTSGADLAGWGYLWLNHEMGHTMTLPDLYAYDGGEGHRFVGTFGLMGLISGLAPEFFAFERWQLGWLDDEQILCQTHGEITTTLSAVEQPGGTKAVIVPTGKTSALVVESRRALGYDAKLSQEGALVYTVDTSIFSGSGPIRVVPASNDDPFRSQSPLAEGASFTLCHVTITVVEAQEEGDTVRVTVGDQPICADSTSQAAPCADIPAPKQADVMVRFVNQSGSEVVVLWENNAQSPAQLVEYFRPGDGAAIDQETYVGHKWIIQEPSGAILQEYTVSEDRQQCVLIKRP